jgi:hypothetical protein
MIRIRTGGQSGVDQGALAAAVELGLAYRGWCPAGGLATNYEQPPGVRSVYPNLTETPSAEPEQRTDWNVRDSDATLILVDESIRATNAGTLFTLECAARHDKPCRIFAMSDPDQLHAARQWLLELGAIRDLNIAGPRETECPGIQAQAREFLLELLSGYLQEEEEFS